MNQLFAFLVALAMTVLSYQGRSFALDCSTLSTPVYVTGSTAAKPLLAEVAKYVATLSAATTIVYVGQGSCAGVDAIVNGTSLQSAGAKVAATWDAAGVEHACDIPDSSPISADIGISDVFASTCFSLPNGLGGNVADFLGPVQAMTFIVPVGSPEVSISAEAAYYVYGFGADSGVSPWTIESAILKRDANSGTQRMMAAAIGVPVTRWRGTASTGSADLLQKLSIATPRESAIGILSTDVAQDNRTVVKILAYQAGRRSCGYLPDRDATSNEKANVRDGHYAIWGPLHLLTRLGSGGYPVKPAAGDVIGFLTGTKTVPGQLDLIFLEAQRHVVPQCAMKVRRTQEMGPIIPHAPVGACGCYYEKVANGATSCTSCQRASDCPASSPVCSYGFCEAS